MDRAEVRFARASDGAYLAYEQFGEGDIDVVFVDAVPSDIERRWRNPLTAALFRRLARFARVTDFDRRGTGWSDRTGEPKPVEEQVDDLWAVMDAADVERAALFGAQSGAALSVLAAAARPGRVSELVTFAFAPRLVESEDWPHGLTEAEVRRIMEALDRMDPEPLMRLVMPSFADDPAARKLYEETRIGSAGPTGSQVALGAADELDVRAILPLVPVPTLVLQPAGAWYLSAQVGEYVAGGIPDARLVALEWPDALFVDPGRVADEIEEFLTGHAPVRPVNRVLATVLFTDIVGSTERAAGLGDDAWRGLLDRHDETAATVVERHGGRLVKSTGDGVMATFDGPARAVETARELHRRLGEIDVTIRAGLHTGEIELRGDDVGGIAVHIASRVQALAGSSETLVTRTVKDLSYGSGIEFEDRGTFELKGVPEPWQVLAVRHDEEKHR